MTDSHYYTAGRKALVVLMYSAFTELLLLCLYIAEEGETPVPGFTVESLIIVLSAGCQM